MRYAVTPKGTFILRCFMVVDLGSQLTHYDEKSAMIPKVLIGWELPTEMQADSGEPFILYQRYPFKLAEKANLRKMLEAWRGSPYTPEDLDIFHLSKLLNQYGMGSITHSTGRDGDKVFANLKTIMGMPKGMPKPPAIYKNTFFSLDPAEFSLETFQGLPAKIKTTIQTSPEWLALQHKMPLQRVS